MIVEKLDNYLGGNGQFLDEEIVANMWDSFSFSVKRQLMEERVLSANLRGSNPGPCARKMAYARLGFEPTEPLEPRSKLTFLTGDLIELIAIGIMRLAGVDVTHTCLDEAGQAEGYFEVGNGDKIPCHADGILEIQTGVTDVRRLLEVKSSSDFGYKLGWLRGDIGDQYMLQHNIYMEAFGLEHGVFFVINKNTGHYHEVLTEKDPEIIEWGRRNYDWAAKATEDNLPPRFVDFKNYGLKRNNNGEISDTLPWGCCLTSDSKVLTPSKDLINIEDVEVGDLVITHDGTTQEVTGISSRAVKAGEKVYEYKPYYFNPIKLTENHPILISTDKETRWITAVELHEQIELNKDLPVNKKVCYYGHFPLGSVARDFDEMPPELFEHRPEANINRGFMNGGVFYVPIQDIKEVEYEGAVHDLEVKDNHNFLTSAGIVHNSYCSFTRYCWPGVDISFDKGKPVYTIPAKFKKKMLEEKDYVIRFGQKDGEPDLDLDF